MIRISKALCFYCGTCASICPQEAIELSDANEVRISEGCVEAKCRKYSCRLCVAACPVGAAYGE